LSDYFRWVSPGVLAGGPNPDPYHDPPALARALADFRANGIGQIVTLTEIPLDLPADAGIEYLHAPTLDGEAPDDLEALCANIDGAKLRGAATFVHCQAGQGRTGTVLAAYLMWSERLVAWDAVDEVRRRYHRAAVESPQQLTALQVFERRHKLI
jgi:atypical dual specificity phosphatase